MTTQLNFPERLTGSLALAMWRLGIMEYAEQIVMYSQILSSGRLDAIISTLQNSSFKGCATAEIGCAAGGTSMLISLLNGGVTHWACDTFEGLLDVGEHDDLENGDFGSPLCTQEIVRNRLAWRKNIKIVPGYFPESAPQEMKDATYAFVHLDTDTYRSMLDGFAFFITRMKHGGYIAMDDVVGTIRGTRGAKVAWQEIQETYRKRIRVLSTSEPQVIVQIV